MHLAYKRLLSIIFKKLSEMGKKRANIPMENS